MPTLVNFIGRTAKAIVLLRGATGWRNEAKGPEANKISLPALRRF
jgi:hypothetical protein